MSGKPLVKTQFLQLFSIMSDYLNKDGDVGDIKKF